ncbi:MAG: carboxymuconolactone decarboxylase family protein [Deltaproteobacteria bacterium]|nr:carboxymuconolactone decarboxylase family protein [Deltaproteobacteria bacterium]
MRLEPIEKPKGLMLRIAYWASKRRLGKVMSPMKVVYARIPGVLKVSYDLATFEEKGIKLDPALKLLVKSVTAQINECGFCMDIAEAIAVQQHIGLEKFHALMDYKTDPRFTERERAALAYAEEATRNKRVSDETFETLRKHFNEREIVEITWVNALENYYNLISIPLGLESDGLCAIAQTRATERGAA